AQEALHIPIELGELGPLGRRREGVDEIERQLPEEYLAQEGSPFPLFLASLLGDLARLLFGGHPDFGGAHANPPGFISIGVDTPQHNYARSSPMSNRAVEGRSRADRALARHRAAKLHSGSSPKWARVIRSFRYSSVPRSSTMSPPAPQKKISPLLLRPTATSHPRSSRSSSRALNVWLTPRPGMLVTLAQAGFPLCLAL